jgi:hypothetical protein
MRDQEVDLDGGLQRWGGTVDQDRGVVRWIRSKRDQESPETHDRDEIHSERITILVQKSVDVVRHLASVVSDGELWLIPSRVRETLVLEMPLVLLELQSNHGGREVSQMQG